MKQHWARHRLRTGIVRGEERSLRISRQWYIWGSLIVSVAAVLAIISASSVGFLGLSIPHVRAASGPKLLTVGTHVHVASCLQAPPQSVKDRTTYTSAELAKYGLPPRSPGEPFAKWAKIVRGAGKRVCDYTIGQERMAESNSFDYAGNYADQDISGQHYSEADMDFFVSCMSTIAPTPPLFPGDSKSDLTTVGYGAWIGIGGIQGAKDLVQVGVSAIGTFNQESQTWQSITYTPFFEEPNNPADSGPHNQTKFQLQCNQHLYVKAWDSGSVGCMYVQRISDGLNASQCYGKHSDELTGEAIVELSPFVTEELGNFGTETFYGVGITDNQNYEAVSSLPHDYFNLYGCNPVGSFPCSMYGHQLGSTGPIQNDPGDVPYDQYAITWHNYD